MGLGVLLFIGIVMVPFFGRAFDMLRNERQFDRSIPLFVYTSMGINTIRLLPFLGAGVLC